MKRINWIICVLIIMTLAIFFPATTRIAKADECSRESLDKLPKKVHVRVEQKCKEKAAGPRYTISNKNSIDSEPTPADVYSGRDKSSLKSKIKKAWKDMWKNDNILDVRFPNADWNRTQSRRWSDAENAYYYQDTSILLVSVVVKTDNKVATIFPAYINKNNDTGKLTMGVATKDSEHVIKQMLIKNFKK